MENYLPLSLLNPQSATLPLAIGASFMLAGLVKGVVGLGLPTVAMGLLSLLMPPMEAAALLIVPSMVTNVWQLAAGPGLAPLLRRLWPMLLAVCGGTLAGGALLPRDGGPAAAIALGLALVLYALAGLAAVRMAVPRAWEARLAPLIGLATGALTSATGVFVLPAVPYLQGLGLAKDALVQALGLAFTVSTMALAASLALQGAFSAGAASHSLYALLPALGGMLIGQWLRQHLQPALFQQCFFAGLLLLGLHSTLRPLLA
ncbi:sulfite exporter TauE/SafE family protein [Janthinobacterium agaricidamnosum]|uniref:Probable membrane transporter protein n=1 Tax=Janthinobacterium agaricidamnosum NBRC 102515 = DSM 9628 TaxID=1349767 RepID=W0VBK9_9BURK|nr:sulfite exporter TauE/SafE family protein [Janthinobacterium agaricidamnosum]CDG85271.1 conserved hypothetical protein [Janthinobacterium agaricidamnosum NBRC 102515 = DSM 9628]